MRNLRSGRCRLQNQSLHRVTGREIQDSGHHLQITSKQNSHCGFLQQKTNCTSVFTFHMPQFTVNTIN